MTKVEHVNSPEVKEQGAIQKNRMVSPKEKSYSEREAIAKWGKRQKENK